jgi:tRNA A-37 threonylcarbamoyl transferase component Bud32
MIENEPDIVKDRDGALRVWRRADLPLSGIQKIIRDNGELLKASDKCATRRVGSFVVKESKGNFLRETVRHTLRRNRYRQGWRAALHLAKHQIPAPRPVAHVEWGMSGIVIRHATICEYLRDCVDVEHFVDALIAKQHPQTALEGYFASLAAAVNRLNETGAVHTDLAGKNILTRDGETFYFIDLDGILLGGNHNSVQRRFTAHVQLYDSFNDRCSDEILAPFLRAMLPERESFELWFVRVKDAQKIRRARTLEAKMRARK